MSVTIADGVQLTVETALSSAMSPAGLWDTGVWDTDAWGPDVSWIDVSQWVRRVDSSRRFSRDLQAWDPATASVVLDNRDRRFSPANLSGPYVVGGITTIRPWRPLRWSAIYNGIRYDGYSGYATAWEETFVAANADAFVTVPCLDEMARFAAFDGLVGSVVGAGELSGLRIHRLLSNAGHTGNRAIDLGLATMGSTTLTQNAADELKLTADSEGGALFIDADGTVVFQQRDALMQNARSNTIQATFGDGTGSELPCSLISVAYNGDLVRNIIALMRVGGTVQIFADNVSRSLYGDRRFTRSDLLTETDGQVLVLAAWQLNQYKDPEYRVTQIQIKPRANPALLYPQVLGRRVRDLIRVVIRPPGGGTITQDCHIAGITHHITGDDWLTTFDLWSATVYQMVGRWDVGTWDTSTWFI